MYSRFCSLFAVVVFVVVVIVANAIVDLLLNLLVILLREGSYCTDFLRVSYVLFLGLFAPLNKKRSCRLIFFMSLFIFSCSCHSFPAPSSVLLA